MWVLFAAMLVIVVLAGLVVLYVAFPHRGEDVPHVPWLGEALRKGVDTVPTIDDPHAAEPAPEPADLTVLEESLARPPHPDA